MKIEQGNLKGPTETNILSASSIISWGSTLG